MRVELEVDSDVRVVVLRVSGELYDEGLLGLADELESLSEAARSFSLLIDLREADGRKISTQGVRDLVAQPRVMSPDSRRAVVVLSDFGFGVARMYESLRENLGGATRPFRDYDEAWRYLTEGIS